MSDPRAPLTPPNCDLSGLEYMPLDVVRLVDSNLAALSTGDEFKAAVLLWCKSWTQVPAASVSADERVQARYVGVSLNEWKSLAPVALRGWVECDDGRLYHPVVAEKALEAWIERLKARKRSAAGNAARYKQTFDPMPFDREIEAATALLSAIEPGPAVSAEAPKLPQGRDPPPTSTTEGSPEPPSRSLKSSEGGVGVGEEGKSPVSNETEAIASPSVDLPADPLDDLRALPIATGSWRLALMVLVDRGGMKDAKARTFLGKLKADGVSPEEFWSIAEAAWEAGTLDPVPYFARAAESVIQRRSAAPMNLTPAETQQRAWMEDFRESPASWRGVRGPRPGEPGCVVKSEILRAFGFEPAEEAVA